MIAPINAQWSKKGESHEIGMQPLRWSHIPDRAGAVPDQALIEERKRLLDLREVFMIGAFFDVVGTIYKGAFWRDISQRHREQKRNRFWVWAYFAWHIAGWPFNLAGLLSEKRWYAAWARDMPWLLRGLTVEDGQELFNWLTEERLIPNLRTDIMDILRDHQAKGHAVALVSASPQELLDTIVSRLDIEHAIGTPLEVQDGRYTGKIAGTLAMNEGKRAALQHFIAEKGFDIHWENSFAYGDSSSDIYLLETVGNPVAVYPDKALKALAIERGWNIIGQREPRT